MAARELAGAHVAALLGQVEAIITEGMERGEFSDRLDARAAAQACLHAMSAFHHPVMLSQEGVPPKAEEARAVPGLLLSGLRAGAATVPG